MKKVIFFLIVVASVFIIKDFVFSIYNLWHKKDLITEQKQELLQEKQKNAELKQQLAQVKTKGFIEAEARNKLFMVKPGEQQIIMPQTESVQKQPEKRGNKPNWQLWWEYFTKE